MGGFFSSAMPTLQEMLTEAELLQIKQLFVS